MPLNKCYTMGDQSSGAYEAADGGEYGRTTLSGTESPQDFDLDELEVFGMK